MYQLMYARQIAKHGVEEAIKADEGLAKGVNTYNGKCTDKNVADSLNIEYTSIYNLI